MGYMKKLFTACVILILHSAICPANPLSIQGIHGPIYVMSAWNLVKGDLILHGQSRFYFKNEVNDRPGFPRTAVTLWNAQGTVNIFYGLSNNYEIGLSQVMYQDAHGGKSGKGYNLPDDIHLKLKMTSLGPADLPIRFGFQIASRIPTAKYHNVPFEPYSAGKFEFSLMALASFSVNSQLPEHSLNAHANFGYLDHNDSGEKLAEGDADIQYESVGSKELIYALGIVYPVSKFNFSFEFYGNRYLTRPPEPAFSRYSYLYVTPGVSYSAYEWLSVVFGFDFRMTSARPNPAARTISINTPVFPTWRLNFGIKFNLMSRLQNRYMENENSAMHRSAGSYTKDIYQQIGDEKKQVENAEKELEQIREERKKMDEILKRLRTVLEEDEQKKDE